MHPLRANRSAPGRSPAREAADDDKASQAGASGRCSAGEGRSKPGRSPIRDVPDGGVSEEKVQLRSPPGRSPQREGDAGDGLRSSLKRTSDSSNDEYVEPKDPETLKKVREATDLLPRCTWSVVGGPYGAPSSPAR